MFLAPDNGFVPYVPPAQTPDAGWLWVAIAYGLGFLILGVYLGSLLWRSRQKRLKEKTP